MSPLCHRRTWAARRLRLNGVGLPASCSSNSLWSYSSLATAQMALLGTDNVCTEFVLYSTIGALAGTFHERFTSSPRASAALNYLAATVYAVLACVIIVEAVRQG